MAAGALASKGAQNYGAPLAVIVLGALWLGTERAYLPHIDDLFMVTWAKAVAEHASLPVHALSLFFATPEYFLNAPRLHVYALAGFFNVAGYSVDSLLLFRSISFVFAAGIVAVVATRLGLSLVAAFFPVVLCITMLHTGLRPESTALILFLAGFGYLWNGESATEASNFLKRTVAKSAVVLAPLAWPSALAYGAALLITSDLRALSHRPVRQLFLEDALALAVGVLVLGGMVGFDYVGFIHVYSGFAVEQAADLFGFETPGIAKGVGLIAAAYVLRPALHHSSFVAYAVGLGSLLSTVLHNKISISVPLTGLAVLAIVDEASQNTRYRKTVWGLGGALFVVMYVNQLIFALGSRFDDSARNEVRAFAQQARAQGRTLLIDEIAAIHGLKLDFGDAYAWNWSRPKPEARPTSVEFIQEGQSWIVSTYTIHSWLRSQGVTGFSAMPPLAATFLPGTMCLMGRNSCRLPAIRWGYYLVERRNGVVSLRVVP